MVRQALVLAAGKGRPVGEPGVPNCLTLVGGVPLVLRWMRVLARAGIKRAAFTIGYEGTQLRRSIEALRAAEPALGLELSFFENPAWDEPNGLSVLAARGFVTERTLLVMADQIVAPRLVERMVRLPDPSGRTVLAVDRDLSRVFDFDDATKVALVEQDAELRVGAISKGMRQPDAHATSTSLFVITPSLVEALGALDRPSLTQGVDHAAKRGEVLAIDVDGALWQDVDSVEMRLHADWLLRVYGDELAHPSVPSKASSPADDTLALIERLLAEKDAARYTLLNPGPVMTSARVKSALVHYDTCHRDGGYSAVVRRLRTKLRPLFGAPDDHEVLLLTSSGTGAMEAAISSTVPNGKKLLVIDNGAFGARLAEIAALHGLAHQVLRYDWGTLPDPADVDAALAADPDLAVVAMIHHETSVGLVNPVAAVGRICRARDRLLIVDAVSALGAEDLDVVRDAIDVCYSSANKCLHAVAGVSFLCVSPRVWPRIADVAPRVYYLDLKRYRRYIEELDQTPFTPAVSSFFALETALDELASQGGVPARRETYRKRNLRIRRVMTDLGFESFTNTGRESHTISTMRVPSHVTVGQLYDEMKDLGFIIYRCKGPLARDHIQIANMGELSDETIDGFLAALANVVEKARVDRTPTGRAHLRSVP